MKLLIITQKVDRNDDILGFFVGWIAEFAKRCEKITVICLQKGEYDFPENVKVLSLGKDKLSVVSRQPSAVKKLKYTFNFYKHIIQERKNYDAVFIHMNQIYVILGAPFWKLWNKKIFLWRNHAKGDWITKLAVFFSDKIFCTSPQSFTAKFKKTKIMPAGIDTGFFKPDSSVRRKLNSILFLGRIAPVKNVDIFIEVLRELKDKGAEFSATIAGSSSDNDAEYEKIIRGKVLMYGLGDRVAFTGAVSRPEALRLFREHELYVNLTLSGSMDKTIFEALASGAKVLVFNTFFRDNLPANWIVKDGENLEVLANAIKNILVDSRVGGSDAEEKISTLLSRHNLNNLMEELAAAFAASGLKEDR